MPTRVLITVKAAVIAPIAVVGFWISYPMVSIVTAYMAAIIVMAARTSKNPHGVPRSDLRAPVSSCPSAGSNSLPFAEPG
ncbi:MAG: hypothetical protein AVDCRST_MAG22-2528 [uncultured Rubrobacteraceae bacterium]|uniref:Uncharacterized protein n=1 Tax=uncultured Rubrobacteraceae bacterium TaxID=349277 RepID=A0A6J4PSH3_9ACTN|nr:MAG: hypothetical protein AVDCRST_MAG22-2528 [uncultured Rubrobacteraceae bacterium]